MCADAHEANPVPVPSPTLSPKRDLRGFTFLPSFREVYDCMISLGQQDKANLYLEALMIYGTEGRVITDDPLVTMGLTPAMKAIDASKRRREEEQSKKKKQAADKNQNT